MQQLNGKVFVIENQFLLDYYEPEKGITIGGTQRYCLDIAKLAKRMGFIVIIIGKACKDYSFIQEEGITVVAKKGLNGSLGTLDFASKVYFECAKVRASITCYSDLSVASIKAYKPSIAIQHGIYNDGPGGNMKKLIESKLFLMGIDNVDLVICVDTNFINWYRERRFEKYLIGKLIYIHNYADIDVFRNNGISNYEDKVLLFPRRFEEHRGFDLFVNMCVKLDQDQCKFKALFAIDNKNLEKAKQYISNRIRNYSLITPDFMEIAHYYSEAYLTYIPSKWSEGTSLSAIESICCGTPVIASDVGGLGNIIIDGFNGHLLAPKCQDYYSISKHLIYNPMIRESLSKNCLSLRGSFSKSEWENKLIRAINRVISI